MFRVKTPGCYALYHGDVINENTRMLYACIVGCGCVIDWFSVDLKPMVWHDKGMYLFSISGA